MTIREAKQVPIVSFLAANGHLPVEQRADGLWYRSPLRSLEASPSFKVNTSRNIWYDHGTGAGGTIIDLVGQFCHVDASGALSVLRGQCWPAADSLSFSFHPPLSENSAERRLTVESVKLLNNPALIRYAESRRIPFALARTYLHECYYSISGKSFFGLGFANDLGGYELRNNLWKGASAPKAITTLNPDCRTVAVFEGFFDMLSALVHFQRTKPVHSVIVLNSLALLETALPTLQAYERVNLFLDNDRAGQAAVETIKQHHSRVTDFASTIYPQHKDFNELLANSPT